MPTEPLDRHEDAAETFITVTEILARWKDRVYAFSTRGPHKGARLEWLRDEQRIFCPKHKARFNADGEHISARGDCGLDRYLVKRQGDTVLVDTSRAYRQDTDGDVWRSASLRSHGGLIAARAGTR